MTEPTHTLREQIAAEIENEWAERGGSPAYGEGLRRAAQITRVAPPDPPHRAEGHVMTHWTGYGRPTPELPGAKDAPVTPADTLRAAAHVLLCTHCYPAQALTDAEMEQLIGTGRPLADCLDCGSREDGQDVAAHLREPLAAWLEETATAVEFLGELADKSLVNAASPLAVARAILGRQQGHGLAAIKDRLAALKAGFEQAIEKTAADAAAHRLCDMRMHGLVQRAEEAERRAAAAEDEVARLRDELEDAAAPVDDLREQLTAARERAEHLQDERDSARDALAAVVAERDAAREMAERWRYVQNLKKAARELNEAMDRAAQGGAKTTPRRLTEQDGGIPNDAYTPDDHPKGI